MDAETRQAFERVHNKLDRILENCAQTRTTCSGHFGRLDQQVRNHVSAHRRTSALWGALLSGGLFAAITIILKLTGVF